jgi:hypothetical protein
LTKKNVDSTQKGSPPVSVSPCDGGDRISYADHWRCDCLQCHYRFTAHKRRVGAAEASTVDGRVRRPRSVVLRAVLRRRVSRPRGGPRRVSGAHEPDDGTRARIRPRRRWARPPSRRRRKRSRCEPLPARPESHRPNLGHLWRGRPCWWRAGVGGPAPRQRPRHILLSGCRGGKQQQPARDPAAACAGVELVRHDARGAAPR